MLGQFRIINKRIITSERVGSSIAEIDFLLIAEDVVADDPVQCRRLRTGLLRPYASSQQA
jgi:hypothetical protein